MRELPIGFTGPMVQAILAGRKTQTRRGVTPPHNEGINPIKLEFDVWQWATKESRRIPKYHVGDRLWVKEAWRAPEEWDKKPPSEIPAGVPIRYEADGEVISDCGWTGGWGRYRHARFMPRAFSRITLEVTAVRCERLNEISEEDAKAEGAMWFDGRPVNHHGWRHDYGAVHATAKHSFQTLWESIHGSDSFDDRWVWVYNFKRVGGPA